MSDIVVVGGGAIGASISLFCKRLDPGAEVVVIEPALGGLFSSTATAGSGGSRRLFSSPENIAMSDYSIRFFQELDAKAQSDLEKVQWRARGYLFIVPPEGIRLLETNLELQTRMGVRAHLMSPAEMAGKFPLLRTDDLGAGAYSPDDGWFDAQRYLAVITQHARQAGVRFVSDEVTAFEEQGRRVTAAQLRSGAQVRGEVFVNAAGPWAQQVSNMIGMELPVNPMCRYEHLFTTQGTHSDMPYVKDLNGLAIRSAQGGYSGGLVDTKVPRGFSQELDPKWFDEKVRPAVEWRFPGMGKLEVARSWAGLYEQCDFDGNAIIGPWSGHRDNFIVAAGFSGHGLMHAPAVGLAVAELVMHGRWQTLDLTRFGYDRIQRGEPYRERGII